MILKYRQDLFNLSLTFRQSEIIRRIYVKL